MKSINILLLIMVVLLLLLLIYFVLTDDVRRYNVIEILVPVIVLTGVSALMSADEKFKQ